MESRTTDRASPEFSVLNASFFIAVGFSQRIGAKNDLGFSPMYLAKAA